MRTGRNRQVRTDVEPAQKSPDVRLIAFGEILSRHETVLGWDNIPGWSFRPDR